jgi:hypothetical protein
MDDKTKLAVGLQTRREVLGAEHVDRSLGEASDFDRPMQELVPAAMEAMRTAEAALTALGVIEPRSEQPSQA